MGTSESDAPPKAPKTSGAQEQPPATSSSPTTTMYPDWSGFQAYSPIPPHGFFHSPVASSPQAHPYMWGAQHLMPPFGTPPPPYVMYPHGGLYAHPSIPPGSHPFGPYAVPSTNGNPEASGAVTTGMEGDGKSSEGKERSPIKRSKGSLGSLNMITGKNNDLSKTSGAANGVFSQSSESGSEGSSDGSDVNSQNDERELKRQKRKQSNRESARRSRLRKQAECEELARRVEALKEENTALRAEVDRMRKDYEQLLAQNASLKEKLGEPTKGSEDAKLDENNQDSVDDTQKHSDSIVKAGQPDSAPSGC